MVLSVCEGLEVSGRGGCPIAINFKRDLRRKKYKLLFCRICLAHFLEENI